MTLSAGMRGAAIAVFALAISAGAHAAGGSTISFGPALLVMTLFAGPLIAFCRTTLTVRRAAPAAALLQLALHLVLAATAGSAHRPTSTSGHHGALTPLPSPPGEFGMTQMNHLSVRMVLTHAIATAIVVYGLTRCDQAIDALRRAFRHIFVRPTRPALIAAPAVPGYVAPVVITLMGCGPRSPRAPPALTI